MNSLYKRFVTMCMISVSSLLAWIYCLFEFRDKPVYIAAISLVVVASLYALFVAAYRIKVSKDAKMEQYISDTINTSVNNMLSGLNQNDNEELERLSKALYVQLRKSNTLLSKMAEENSQANLNTQNLIAETIDKATKITIKYNQLNNNKLIASNTEMSTGLTNTYKELVDTLGKLNAELIVLRNTAPTQVPFNNQEATSSINSLDIFQEEDTAGAIDDFYSEFAPSTEESTSEALSLQEDIPVVEETPAKDEADIIPFPVAEINPEPEIAPTSVPMDDNPNRTLSPDEIAAMFASMDSGSSVTVSEPELEPIPEPVIAPVDDNPNRTLSPDEIAAMFASMDSGSNTSVIEPEPEPIPEPVITPVDDNPNRTMSPDEIAALFASMQ